MRSPSTGLPFGSEFSPSQIDLPRLLELIEAHAGDCNGLQGAIRETFFSKHGGGSLKNQWTLAMNCRLGLKAYGVIDDTCKLTDFGRVLLNLRSNARKIYDSLATYILLHLNGMNLIQCIRDMNSSGAQITLTSLRDALAARGIHFPSGGKHPSMMRLWLEKAGVFVGGRWQIDEDRISILIGTSAEDFAGLQGLSPEQKAFLRALANTGERSPQPANEIAKLAANTFGVKFPEKSLPKSVLGGLVESGYITVEKTTSGRGAKPFTVAPTAKLQADVISPMLAQLETQADPKVIALLRLSTAEILNELPSRNRYKAGLALEALAFKLMRLLDMTYAATRLRAQSTGGAEVDLIFESARLAFSRWQIQCKNTAHVSLDDVAKEVGLTYVLNSNVIVIVSTGAVGPEARRYANKVMAESNLCIVMVDGKDLRRISETPASIVDVFSREAKHASALKKLGPAGCHSV